MIWKNKTQVFQTIGVPPRIGRTLFATIGSITNIRSEPTKSVAPNSATSAKDASLFGESGDPITGLSDERAEHQRAAVFHRRDGKSRATTAMRWGSSASTRAR